jgi:nitroreductase
MNAPSACNEQGWKIIYIDETSVFKDLTERGAASFLGKAKQAFLLCYSRETDNLEWADHIQSGAAFVTTFSLLAHSMGIGSCWVGHLPNKAEVSRVFGIPSYYEPVALVSFGYYHTRVKIQPRKWDAVQLIASNHFPRDCGRRKSVWKLRLRTFLRLLYYRTPVTIRRRLKRYSLRFERKFYYEVHDC